MGGGGKRRVWPPGLCRGEGLGWQGRVCPVASFFCREAFLYVLLVWGGGWCLFFLSFLHFYNLNYKPPEQMSNLLVIE